MTHDELLAKMAQIAHTKDANEARNDYLLALRAVVELHKPALNNSEYADDDCMPCFVKYPCPTIQAITNQLL